MKEKSPQYFRETKPLLVFFSYFKPHLPLFLLDMTSALFICIIDLSFPLLSRHALYNYLPQGEYRKFFLLVLYLVCAYFLKGILYYMVSYWGHIFGVRVEADMRRDVFSHLEAQSFSFYDKRRTGILMSHVTTDLFEVTELAHHGPEDLFISTVTLVGAFAIMLSINWELALIVFAIIPLFLLFTILQRKKMRKASLGVKGETAGVNSTIESSISGMRTAKAFGNEESELHKFHRMNLNFIRAKENYYSVMATFQGGMELFISFLPVIVIAAGGFFILEGKLETADLLVFTLYVSTFTTPIKKLSAFVEQFMQGWAGFTRFLGLMKIEPSIQDKEDAITLDNVAGEISFEDVSFHYEDEREVLKNISLTIKQGEKFAFVGTSGGGKSTLCQLIPRFYEVSSGRIKLDGTDIRDCTQASLRKNIGMVQQDVFLFADSILENIRYGRVDATDEEVIEAAKKAEIHKDILEMPEGYHSFVGERGVMLSGGQKQRISIARVFLKNPPVVILDEATSALDSVTEAKIQSAFDKLCEGRSSIVIAHRLSTIQNAHRIALIEEGGLLELGSHESLMAAKGHYAKLVESQLKH